MVGAFVFFAVLIFLGNTSGDPSETSVFTLLHKVVLAGSVGAAVFRGLNALMETS